MKASFLPRGAGPVPPKQPAFPPLSPFGLPSGGLGAAHRLPPSCLHLFQDAPHISAFGGLGAPKLTVSLRVASTQSSLLQEGLREAKSNLPQEPSPGLAAQAAAPSKVQRQRKDQEQMCQS